MVSIFKLEQAPLLDDELADRVQHILSPDERSLAAKP
jgi:hypothetical protein